jgi:hypothetical protein
MAHDAAPAGDGGQPGIGEGSLSPRKIALQHHLAVGF